MSAVSNARWIATAQAAKIAVQFVSVAVLARLLTPEDYGLIAMVWVVGNLVGQLRDMGTAAAIVQEQELTAETINAVFWINVALGILLCCAVLLLAAPVAALFKAAPVSFLLSMLAPTFVIGGLGAVPRALLERRSAFRIVAGVEIASSLLGLVITIAAALLGAGAMSFIWGVIAMSIVSTAAYLRSAGWKPGAIAGSSRLGAVLRFSGNLSGFNLINYAARNADSFVIGRYLGAAPLGIYSTAYKIMLFPLQNMTFVANRALFPVMSRFETTAEMRTLYLKSLSVIVTLTAPLMAGVFVLREPFIHAFLGERWLEAADVLVWLAPVGFLQSMVSTTGTVSMVRGRTDLLLSFGGLASILHIIGFFIGVQWGVLGVACAYFVTNLIGAVPALALALRLLDGSFTDVLRNVWAAIACALAMAAVVGSADRWLIPASMPEIARLVAGVAVGALVYGALMLTLFPARLRLALTLVPALRER